MRRWFWLLGCLLILGVWPLLAQSPDGAHWRLGHFAIDVPDVDIYLDNTLMLQGITLASLSDWRDLTSGAHTVTITPVGGTVDRPLITPFTLNLQAGEWVTLALAGRRTDGSLKLHAVVEDMQAIAPGLTRLSVFNAFPNNPPLTIRLAEKDLIRLLAYPGTRPEGNDGMETRNILAGSYPLTIELSDGQLVKELPNVGLGVGRAYLLVIFGTLDKPFTLLIGTPIGVNGTPVIAVPVIIPTATPAASTPVVVVPTSTLAALVPNPTDTASAPATVTLAVPSTSSGGTAQVRFGHFAPGTPDFLFYIDSQILGTLARNQMTAYQDVALGTHTLSLVLTNESLDQAFLRQTVTFDAGGVYLVAAIGSLQIGSFSVVTAPENRITDTPGTAQVALFNAIPDAKEIALLNGDKVVMKKVAFPLAYVGAGTGYSAASVLAGVYEFDVAIDNGDGTFTPLTTLPKLRLGAGRYYTLIITGLRDQATPPYLIFSSYPPSAPVPTQLGLTPVATAAR